MVINLSTIKWCFKRIVDIVWSTLLLVLVIPVFCFIALALKMESPEPVENDFVPISSGHIILPEIQTSG